jgi:hypothetical protein
VQERDPWCVVRHNYSVRRYWYTTLYSTRSILQICIFVNQSLQTLCIHMNTVENAYLNIRYCCRALHTYSILRLNRPSVTKNFHHTFSLSWSKLSSNNHSSDGTTFCLAFSHNNGYASRQRTSISSTNQLRRPENIGSNKFLGLSSLSPDLFG